jgi:hypothetical protein
MSRASSEINSLQPLETRLKPLSVPIILDSGDQARVVPVAFRYTPKVGDRFGFQGSVWEITRVQDFQRGYVAQRVRPGVCVH